MNQLSGSLSGLSSCRVAIALAGIFFATLASQCQSEPATLIPGCPNPDQHAALAGHSPIGNSNSESEETDVAIGAASAVILDVRGSVFPGASAHRSSRAYFSQPVRLSSNTVQLFSLPVVHADAIFRGCEPCSFPGASAVRWGLCDSGSRTRAHRFPQSRQPHSPIRPCPVAVKAADSKVRTSYGSRSHSSRLRRRPQKLSQMGLRSHLTKQTSRKSDATISLLRRSGQFRSSYKSALNYLGIGDAHVPMNLQEIQNGRR